MTADTSFAKTHPSPIFSLFNFCNTAQPSQQRLSSCGSLLIVLTAFVCIPPSLLNSVCQRPLWLAPMPSRLSAGRRHVGKVVYTDYEEVLIWYECDLVDVSGACAFGRSRLEILQRTRNANGNLYLVHRDLVRSLCVDPKRLELVSHHGNSQSPIRIIPDCNSSRVPIIAGPLGIDGSAGPLALHRQLVCLG